MSATPNSAIAPLLYQSLKTSEDNDDEREIRLLSITGPISEDSIINCSLQTVSLSQAKDNYFALSYVWGDASDRVPILVNGHSFQATRNLVEALHHVPIAEPRCKKALWVDAVCINQHDIPERNSQVSMMGLIYTYAQQVVSWLGPSDEIDDGVIEFINQLNRDTIALPDSVPFHKPIYAELVAKIHPHRLLRSPLFQEKEYWRRVWTYQEGVLARDCQVIAGSSSFSLDTMDDIILWILEFHNALIRNEAEVKYRFSRGDSLRQIPMQVWTFVQEVYEDADFNIPITSISTERHRAKYKNKDINNSFDEGLVYIYRMRWRKATDARDKIYSVAGLGAISIKVDYATPVEDVYTSWAAHMIEKATMMELLLDGAGLANHHSTLALPSWVPDWSSSKPYSAVIRTGHFDIQEAAPAKSRIASVMGKKLHLIGIKIGEIQDVMPYVSYEADSDQNLEAQTNIIRKVVEFYLRRESQDIIKDIILQAPKGNLYPTGIPVITAILQLVWQNGPAAWKAGRWVREALAPLLALLVEQGREPVATEHQEDPEEAQRKSSAEETLSSICDCERTEPIPMADLRKSIKGVKYDYLVRTSDLIPTGVAPFITTSGLMGSAVWLIQPGDVIFAVGSARMPLILRKSEVSGEYTFLSCCFVAGVMEREIWADVENGTSNLEEILIV